LTQDSIKQKYAQTVVSTRIVLGCVQFLGEEKRFYAAWTQSGSWMFGRIFGLDGRERAIASCGWFRYIALTVKAEEPLRMNESTTENVPLLSCKIS
jgi:hypothetical protein